MTSRRRSHGGRTRVRPRWKWTGQFLATAQTPADAVVNFHVLYDPRDVDGSNESETTVCRNVGNYFVTNPPTTVNSNIGMGIYLVEQNAAGAITTEVDPLGVLDEDVEVNNRLYHRIDFIRVKEGAGDRSGVVRIDIDTKVRRVIKGRHLLVLAVRGDTALAWQYSFAMHTLVREGAR